MRTGKFWWGKVGEFGKIKFGKIKLILPNSPTFPHQNFPVRMVGSLLYMCISNRYIARLL